MDHMFADGNKCSGTFASCPVLKESRFQENTCLDKDFYDRKIVPKERLILRRNGTVFTT